MNSFLFKSPAVVLLASMFLATAFAADMPAEPEYTNSVGMKFVRIKPGTFRMGQLQTPLPLEAYPATRDFLQDGDYDEKPVHTVTITRPFYMGIFEVTNFQYELFDPSHKDLRGKDAKLSSKDDEAVVNVNWYDAQAFCRWLSDKEGVTYRLPTEAEWEYACRAGTTTNFYTGETLPEEFHKNPHRSAARYVSLRVGDTPANQWGLYDMHGNVEEWCYDWYGPYTSDIQTDPAGYTTGSFHVTRGGSHGTDVYYLRSANRMGAVPQVRNWITGFRVVIGEMPDKAALRKPALQRYQKNVVPRTKKQISKGPDPDKPYFKGPRRFVNIPVDMSGPVFASHNHNTALVECPNGDLLASWFSTVAEGGREMVQGCSRLRWNDEQWDQASQLWDAPDRNDSGHRLWYNGKDTIYHFANPSFAAVSMAILAIRESTDNGVTWSVPRVVLPEFARGQGPANMIFRLKDGAIAFPTDFGGSRVWISRDETLTWNRASGETAGFHAPVIQLDDGRLIAFGRGGNIDGMMPMSISSDIGKSWTYSASEFPPIGGKQKAVLLKLKQGPLFFASFADLGTDIVDASGTKRKIRGLFAAVSNDNGKTWFNKRLVTDDGPPRPVETTAGGLCLMSSSNGEFRGYMSAIQATNDLIHLITSRQHYAFNLKWLTTPQPAAATPLAVKNEVETFNGPDFDLDGWAHYHSSRCEFNGKGQYSIETRSPVSGIDRVVGKGSFDMTLSIKDIRFGPSLRETSPIFTFLIKDDRVRSVVLSMNAHGLGFTLKDLEADKAYEPDPDHKVEFKSAPKSAKFRIVYDENARRMRYYYGIDGAEANTETPQSSAGIYLSQPLTESTVVYLLFTDGKIELDHYQVKPIEM
ncbi:MAG: SUMF1/EgtB/PvdO family nonheme iron enzyme [Planctomycetota bacterium]|jgi:formylglycine-generating enzyme required for sulfatase activity